MGNPAAVDPVLHRACLGPGSEVIEQEAGLLPPAPERAMLCSRGDAPAHAIDFLRVRRREWILPLDLGDERHPPALAVDRVFARSTSMPVTSWRWKLFSSSPWIGVGLPPGRYGRHLESTDRPPLSVLSALDLGVHFAGNGSPPELFISSRVEDADAKNQARTRVSETCPIFLRVLASFCVEMRNRACSLLWKNSRSVFSSNFQ